jgi:hypothetical protein
VRNEWTVGDERNEPGSDPSVTPSDLAGQATQLIPTGSKRRIPLIDVLRGFALFGVLLINLIDLAGWGISIDDGRGRSS